MLRHALQAAGNPACRLKDVLQLCDTCTGSCGIAFDFEFQSECFCGEAVVKSLVRKLVNETAAEA